MIGTNGLHFSYTKGGTEIFGGLTYDFPEGEVTVVTGPSGSGKSTLLYLLGLLITPTSGTISYDKRSVSGIPDRERSHIRAQVVGFVFQDAALDPTRTVLDNVVEGALYAGSRRREAEVRARELLESLGVRLRETHRPGEVSGGQAQRIGICRALIKNPSVVLADEPTGNLDRESAEVVLAALSDAASTGATVVISSHDPAVVQRGDHVLAI